MDDNGNFIKTLFKKHASVNVFAQLSSAISPVLCTVFAGRMFGSSGLTVMSICSPLFFLAAFFGIVISGGSSALATKYIAKDDIKKVNGIYSLAIILSLAVGIIVSLLLFILKSPVLHLLTNDEALVAASEQYYLFLIPYIFFTIIVYLPLYWARVYGRPEIGMILTLILTFGTLIFNFLFLFGFKMNIEGIALSQGVSTAFAFFISTFLIQKKLRNFKFSWSFDFKKVKDIAVMGSPMGMMRIYSFICVLIINLMLLNSYGHSAVAVYGTISTISKFITAVVSGISSVIIPIVGVLYGEKDNTSINQIVRYSFTYGNIIILIISGVLIIFNGLISSLFGLSGDETEIFKYAVICYGMFYVIYVNNNIFTAYFNAISRVKIANLISFSQDFIFLLISVVSFSTIFDAKLFWLCFPAAALLASLVLLEALLITSRKNKELSFPLLCDTKYETDGKYVSFSVDNDIGSAVICSEKITDFCEENDLSPKLVMMISMAIEELITLIIQNADNSKYYSIAVRLFLIDDSITLRIRNGGKKFNPIKYYDENISNDIEKSMDVIGLKYIIEAANIVYYRETFGVNNLVVVF